MFQALADNLARFLNLTKRETDSLCRRRTGPPTRWREGHRLSIVDAASYALGARHPLRHPLVPDVFEAFEGEQGEEGVGGPDGDRDGELAVAGGTFEADVQNPVEDDDAKAEDKA